MERVPQKHLNIFRRNLRRLRTEAGFSQEALAEKPASPSLIADDRSWRLWLLSRRLDSITKSAQRQLG